MGGGADQPKFSVPDWRIYEKKVQEIPVLQEHVQKLAKLGLKDPWIRNEAWRYMPENTVQGTFMPFRLTFLRTFKYALVAAASLVAVEKFLLPAKKGLHIDNCKWCQRDKAKYGDKWRYEEPREGHGHH